MRKHRLQGADKAVEQGADPEVVKTLMLALNSFNHFDKDGNGSLTQVLERASVVHYNHADIEPGKGSMRSSVAAAISRPCQRVAGLHMCLCFLLPSVQGREWGDGASGRG